MIEVNDLHKKFGKVKVLNGIHLEYHPGKIYGLVGENGAGKTTLFNCMTGIYDYTGSITKSKTLKAGYLSASNFFYSQITGLEYLEFCMKAKGLPVSTLTIQHLNEIFHVFLLCFPSIYSKIVSLTEAGFTHYPQKKTHVYQGTSDMRYTGDSSIYMSLII